MTATEVREAVLSWLNNVPKLNGCAIPSAGERGIVIGLMNNALRLGKDMASANARRHQVLAWIFRDILGKPNATWLSAKDLTDEQWWALIKWVEPHKDIDTDRWIAHECFDHDMYLCWQAMEVWQRDFENQLEMPI